MVINKYFYKYGDCVLDDRVELIKDRSSYMTNDYMQLFTDSIGDTIFDGNVAFLYSGGSTIAQSEARKYEGNHSNSLSMAKAGPVIKDLTAYMLHRYVGVLVKAGNNVTYASTNGNTCASSMFSIYEAEQLLKREDIDHVVIVAEEKTSFNTIRIFKEHRIDVKPGDGFACIVLSKNGDGISITDTKWGYSWNNNPFLVDAAGYSTVFTEADYYKGHQTGTAQNDEAEREVFGDNIIGYKDKIGHTQGASALIELCMVIEDIKEGTVLCTASGLGGFYGSCLVRM